MTTRRVVFIEHASCLCVRDGAIAAQPAGPAVGVVDVEVADRVEEAFIGHPVAVIIQKVADLGERLWAVQTHPSSPGTLASQTKAPVHVPKAFTVLQLGGSWMTPSSAALLQLSSMALQVSWAGMSAVHGDQPLRMLQD